MRKFLKIILVLALLADLPSLAKTSSAYDNLDLASGTDLNMVLAVAHDDKTLDLSTNPQLRLKIDATNLLVSKNGDRSFKVDLFLVNADGSREFISSQNTTLNKDRNKNRNKSLTLSVDSQSLDNGTNRLQFDVFDTEAKHINTYNLELIAFNKPDKQIDPEDVDAPQTIPNKAECSDSAFGDCQLDYFFRKVSFEASAQKQAATRVVKDNGKYKIVIPFGSGTITNKNLLITQSGNGRGDNLGNHIATQDLDMDFNNIIRALNITATTFNGALNGNAATASFAANTNNATTANTADFATSAGSANTATTAATATTATTATTALTAGTANTALTAVNATFAANTDNATTANIADVATLATFASNTDNATTANVADYATIAASAMSSLSATDAVNFTGVLSGDVIGPQNGTVIESAIITGKKLLGEFNPLAGTVSNQDTLYTVFEKLTGNIDSNTSNIATNTTDIATNTANITTNTTDIATNTANIASNTADIATNTSNIANLQATLDQATSSNVANTIVKRDANGDFSATNITAHFIGNITGDVTGNVTGNVTGSATTAASLANGGNSLSMAGGQSVTLNTTGSTTLTLPTSGTLATTTGLTPMAINPVAINTDGITTINATGLNFIKLTEINTAGAAETISTITGGIAGQRLVILIVEGGVTTQVKFINNETNTANTINLRSTSDITTDKNDILELIYDGTKWYEISFMGN